ncbi:protein of unknown function [Micropruina glycogenica]|uniref:Uncharacterized protein n=1 Tax=Micropruina glycogenica TaxID=75385 RepID=A0A2N9JMW5_9ACTN|nr:protein of unknown function [Micropruina glycogenica]
MRPGEITDADQATAERASPADRLPCGVFSNATRLSETRHVVGLQHESLVGTMRARAIAEKAALQARAGSSEPRRPNG